MSADAEYAVKAETFQGNTLILRRGFSTREAAEDHPVQMKLWNRVWVEAVGPALKPKGEAVLPPLPWDMVTSEGADVRGQFHIYIVDANGRKIAAIWGSGGSKKLTADRILDAVNGGPK